MSLLSHGNEIKIKEKFHEVEINKSNKPPKTPIKAHSRPKQKIQSAEFYDDDASEEIVEEKDLTSLGSVEKVQLEIEKILLKTFKKKEMTISLDHKINELNKAIDVYRAKIGGRNALKLNETMISKQSSIMENRLMKTKRDYMEAQCKAEAIKLEINDYRRDMNLIKKSLHKNEHSIRDITRKGNELEITIAERAAAIDKVTKTIDKYRIVGEAKEEEFSNEYISIPTNVNRINSKRRRMESEKEKKLGTMTQQEERDVFNMNKLSDWESATAEHLKDKAMERMNLYKAALKEIGNKLNYTDPDIMVNDVVTLDKSNFDLYNFIEQVATDIKIVEAQLEDVKHKHIEEENEDSNEIREAKLVKLKRLKNDIETQERESKRLHNLYIKQMAIAENIRGGIEKIFSCIKLKNSEEDPMMEDIYRTEDLTTLIRVNNMNHYLGVLELKAIQVLRNAANIERFLTDDKKGFKRGKSLMLLTPLGSNTGSFDFPSSQTAAESMQSSSLTKKINNKVIKIDTPSSLPKKPHTRAKVGNMTNSSKPEVEEEDHIFVDSSLPLSRKELEMEIVKVYDKKGNKEKVTVADKRFKIANIISMTRK